MAVYTPIDKSTSFMNPLKYTGTGTSNALTGLGFQPDLVWIKNVSGTDTPILANSVSGATKYLVNSQTYSQSTNVESVKSFDADGFTVGTQAAVNDNTDTLRSWNWKMGTTSGITTNGSTTITPSSYSFNATAGQSVLLYTGNATAGAKLAHGLGKVPALVIIKNYASGSEGWSVYHKMMGNTKYIKLNTAAAAVIATNRWNDTTPDDVNITLGDDPSVNGSTTMIAYCFAEVNGYSRMGNYTGNAEAFPKGVFVTTGFKPSFFLVKRYDTGTEPWLLFDNTQLGYNQNNSRWNANEDVAENTVTEVNLMSNGFDIISTGAHINASAGNFLYIAFGQSIVGSNGVCATGR